MSESPLPGQGLPRALELAALPGQVPEQPERWWTLLGPEGLERKRYALQHRRDAFPVVRFDRVRFVRAGHPSSLRLACQQCSADWCLSAVRERVPPTPSKAIKGNNTSRKCARCLLLGSFLDTHGPCCFGQMRKTTPTARFLGPTVAMTLWESQQKLSID